jgi:hypothetical protein
VLINGSPYEFPLAVCDWAPAEAKKEVSISLARLRSEFFGQNHPVGVAPSGKVFDHESGSPDKFRFFSLGVGFDFPQFLTAVALNQNVRVMAPGHTILIVGNLAWLFLEAHDIWVAIEQEEGIQLVPGFPLEHAAHLPAWVFSSGAGIRPLYHLAHSKLTWFGKFNRGDFPNVPLSRKLPQALVEDVVRLYVRHYSTPGILYLVLLFSNLPDPW